MFHGILVRISSGKTLDKALLDTVRISRHQERARNLETK